MTLSVNLLEEQRLSPLAAAFLSGRDSELWSPFEPQPAGELPPAPTGPAPDRRELAAALGATNTSYGHPRARELAAKLADPGTRVVVTGQQPGLFGGPLYALSKAVAAVRWAERLEEAGQPAVAVYWVATEDHDYAEVASAVVEGPQGARRFELGDDPSPLAPVGVRSLGPEVATVLDQVRDLYPAESPRGRQWRDWWDEVGRWYRPDARFGEAFSRLMVGQLGERSPLLLDALLPQLKAAQRPWLARLLEERVAVHRELAAAAERVRAAGYKPQIRPQSGASPLFLLERGQRRRIEWTDLDEGRWELRGANVGGDLSDLEGRLADNPIVVSPGALARPAIQDAVLGSTLQVLGPGEVAYMAQAAALYPILGLTPPRTSLRPQALVLSEELQGKLAQTGLDLARVIGDRAEIDQRLAERSGADLVAPIRERIEQELDGLTSQVLEVDSHLEKPWKKTSDNVLRALDNFSARLAAAAARADEVTTGRVDRLRESLLPEGHAQERVICSASFTGLYGDSFRESLFAGLGADPAVLHVVSPRG